MPTMNEMVDDFLAQKRIGVAGVARDGKSPANAIYKKLKKEGHQVYAINPNADMLEGDKAYANVKSTPEKLDGVVVVTTPEVSKQIVQECAEAGISRVWLHGSFVHGSSVTDEAVQFGQEHHVTVIAGGCPMMYGQNADIFHKGMCWWMKTTGSLPK
ncbi:MAG: CoA-binding protein [Chloroflexota bacterium]